MKRINDWRKSHMLASDTIIVVILLASIALVVHLCGTTPTILETLNGNRPQTYSAVASIAGSLLGFVITAVSIIAAFAGMPRFSMLRNAAQFTAIFHVFFDAIYWLAAATTIALVALVFDTDKSPVASLSLMSLVIFGITTARVWRCVWILQRLSKILVKPLPESQETPTNDP